MERRGTLLFSVLLLSLSVLAIADDPDCVYTIYIRTGSIINGGTDSKISATFYASNGDGIWIKDLEAWGGLMGPGYNYFERGNLDIFSGRGPCLGAPICKLNLTSDGTGKHPGWYVKYVEVTSTGVHIPCNQKHFDVMQWLALDTPPYELTAIRDYCRKPDDSDHQGRLKQFGLPNTARLRSVV